VIEKNRIKDQALRSIATECRGIRSVQGERLPVQMQKSPVVNERLAPGTWPQGPASEFKITFR
jgi:hypothetical protein